MPSYVRAGIRKCARIRALSMSFYYPWKMAGLFCLKVGPLFSLKGMGLSFEGFNEGVNGKSPI